MGVDYSTDAKANGEYNQSRSLPPQMHSHHTKALSHDNAARPFKQKNALQNRSITALDIGNPKPMKTEKTIYVEADNKKRVKITFEISEEDNLTCGWLVSETIRQFANSKIQEASVNRPIVALQTLTNIITFDYWLSDLERSVKVLQDGMVLKPFYGNTEYILTNQKINLDYFEILKLIGTGGFSKVYLARRKDNGQFYAIKVISKREMLKKDKEENVFNERNIMTRLDHPFLVKLHYAFQTNEKLFLVMDFCPGGEMFYHLIQRKKLKEEEAKIYMGEIILALNYLHKNNIIYRDLKPENILLDIDGHVHLADYGLCKITRNKSDPNYTFCGSPEFMAPEVITRSGYNFSADFYTLGILVYEMVVGRPPFNADRQQEIFDKVLNNEPYFPPHISPNLKLFISQLIEKNPNERLGSKHGLSEVVNHPWCKDLDIVKIATKKVRAPIIPDINRTNFAREFIDARATFINDNMADAYPDQEGESTPGGGSQMLYGKFANFSFYSNIDDPLDKFQDSIFDSNENSFEDSSPHKERRLSHNGRFHFATILHGLNQEEEKEKTSANVFQVERNTDFQNFGKSPKEDFTEELNEMSPSAKFFPKYNREKETKFLREAGRLSYFDTKAGTDSFDNKRPPSSKKSPVINGYQKQGSGSFTGKNITYKFPPRNSKLISEQVPSKEVRTITNTPNASYKDLGAFSSNLYEVSDEVTLKKDRPTTQIDNKRASYNGGFFRFEPQSQNGGMKPGDNYSFTTRNDATVQKTNSFKNVNEFKGSKIGMSERIIQK